MSQASYRWTCYPGLRWDLLHYRFRGMPLPYGVATKPPERVDDVVDWLIDKCAELHLSPLYMTTIWFDGEKGAREFRTRAADCGIEYISSGGGAFAATDDEWRLDYTKIVGEMRLAAAGGAKIMAMVNADAPGPPGQPVPNGGTRFGHFSKEMPISAQIDNMVCHFGELVQVAGDLGLVLAFENHMDYRIAEIVEVVKAVGSPALGINYDFANSFAVVEDQVEAARIAAPYTVMTHIKDMRVQSITTTGEPAFLHAPIGHGDVDVLTILEIQHANAPNPGALPQCIEVCTLPQFDPDLWMRLSIDFLRDHARNYFG
jgi:sugar phosphate isomerase/epimerase